jgi:hypothetical protein
MAVPPLHVLLPEIERAAQRRVDSPVLAELDAHELRDLLYDVVATYQRRLADPSHYVDVLVGEAHERHADLVEARERRIEVRALFLERLLDVITPAVPALIGPVVQECRRQKGQPELRQEHVLLRGFELVADIRRPQLAKKKFSITGRSWWVVTLAPEEKTDEVAPRYAYLEYDGEADEDEGSEHWWTHVHLCTPLEVAETIGDVRVSNANAPRTSGDRTPRGDDDPFAQLVASVLGRLRAAGSEKTATLTEDTWQHVQRIETALAVLRGTT